MGYNGIGTVRLAARFIIASLLEADGAAAGSLVVRCRDADMVTAALVGQARMVTPVRTLPVDVQGPQLHLIIHQGFGVVTIGKVYPDNLLILWVKVVEPPGEERCQVREKKKKARSGETHRSMMARAVGLLIRSLAVRMVRRLLPSLVIDSICRKNM